MTRSLPQVRRSGVLLALVALVAALVLGTAAPASAHALLVSTDPVEGSVLPESPERITFTFSEAVTSVPDGVQAYDAAGEPLGSAVEVSGEEVGVVLDEEVAEGTVVVVWRVLSDDGHPVSGSLTFSVGAPSPTVVPPPDVDTSTSDVPPELSAARGVGYVGLLLAVGLVGFALLLLPGDRTADRARRRLVVATRGATAVTALAWLVTLPLTATYQLGSQGSWTSGDAWALLTPTEYGVVAAVVLGTALAVLLLGDGRPGPARTRVALAAAAVAVAAPALTGHTRAAPPELLAIGADVVHLVAGSVWLGGLVALVLVLPDLAGRGELGAEVLARFSGVGAVVLGVLVVTGSVLAWRILGSWGGLVDTGYGRLLLVKIGAAAVVAALAAWNRFALVPRFRRAERRRDRRSGAELVVRTTFAEAGVLVALLLVTGVLVDTSPETGRAAVEAADTGPHEGQLGPYEIVAAISPHTVGPNTVTVQVRDGGAPIDALEAPRARLSADDVDLGALALEKVGIGTYSAEVVVPAAGRWDLQVSLRTTEFDNPVTSLRFTVSER